MKPRVFLDIDGVLNHSVTYTVFDYPRLFKRQCLLLDEIYKATDCEIVLVTNWGYIIGVAATAQHLAYAGIGAPVIGKTALCGSRGAGVREYPHEAYVILDDLPDYYADQVLLQTDPNVGLTPELVQLAIRILQSDHALR
jgi:hypothetical protein